MEEAVHVKAKPIPKPPVGDQINEALYRFCVHFPAYTLQEARKLPFNHVLGLLTTKRKEQAAEYIELLNIATAPHTKKGSGVKKLQSKYRESLNG